MPVDADEFRLRDDLKRKEMKELKFENNLHRSKYDALKTY